MSLMKGAGWRGVEQKGQMVWKPWDPWGTCTWDQYLSRQKRKLPVPVETKTQATSTNSNKNTSDQYQLKQKHVTGMNSNKNTRDQYQLKQKHKWPAPPQTKTQMTSTCSGKNHQRPVSTH